MIRSSNAPPRPSNDFKIAALREQKAVQNSNSVKIQRKNELKILMKVAAAAAARAERMDAVMLLWAGCASVAAMLLPPSWPPI